MEEEGKELKTRGYGKRVRGVIFDIVCCGVGRGTEEIKKGQEKEVLLAFKKVFVVMVTTAFWYDERSLL